MTDNDLATTTYQQERDIDLYIWRDTVTQPETEYRQERDMDLYIWRDMVT